MRQAPAERPRSPTLPRWGAQRRSSPGELPSSSPRRWDTVSFLTLWLVLLYLITARQVIGPLGSLGPPATLLAMAAAVLWIGAWLHPASGLVRARHPMRPLLLVYAWYAVISFTVAMLRPLTEIELMGAQRALVTTFAMVGIALLVADGVTHLDGIVRILRRLLWLGAVLAVLGVLEFAYGVRLQPRIPGLSLDSLPSIAVRDGLNRPRGTALHPIEFSVVVAALLPIAIHFALYDDSGARRRVAAVVVVLLGAAVPVGLSRSGVLALVTALLVLAVGWNRRRLLNAAALMLAGLTALWLLSPRLSSAVAGLFREPQESYSIQARVDRVPDIMSFIGARPWFGLGNGTWGVEDYFLVDNEVWVTTLETGVVGLSLTLALIVAGIVLGRGVRRSPFADEATAHLGRAVAASIAGLGVSLATFDAFHYRILTGTLFLMLGISGALWRLSPPARNADAASGPGGTGGSRAPGHRREGSVTRHADGVPPS